MGLLLADNVLFEQLGSVCVGVRMGQFVKERVLPGRAETSPQKSNPEPYCNLSPILPH